MANWSDLKAAVAKVIKTNGNQEITGAVLQNALNNIISNVGENASFAGVATPSTNPGTPDGNVFYIASESGTYDNFDGIVNNGECLIFKKNEDSWVSAETGIITNKKLSNLLGLVIDTSTFVNGQWINNGESLSNNNNSSYLRNSVPIPISAFPDTIISLYSNTGQRKRIADMGLTLKFRNKSKQDVSFRYVQSGQCIQLSAEASELYIYGTTENINNINEFSFLGFISTNSLVQDIAQNTQDIAQNTQDIAQNTQDIKALNNMSVGGSVNYTTGAQLGVYPNHAYTGSTLGDNPVSNATNSALGRIDASDIPDNTLIYITKSGENIYDGITFKFFNSSGNQVDATTGGSSSEKNRGRLKPNGAVVLGLHIGNAHIKEGDAETYMSDFHINNVPNKQQGFDVRITENTQDIAQNTQDIEALNNMLVGGGSVNYTTGAQLGVYPNHAYTGSTLGDNPVSNATNSALGRIDASDIPDNTLIYITKSGENIYDGITFKFFNSSGNQVDATTGGSSSEKNRGRLKPNGAVVLGLHIGNAHIKEGDAETYMSDFHINNVPNKQQGFDVRITENTQDIAQNTQDIAQNTQDIKALNNTVTELRDDFENISVSDYKATLKILFIGSSFGVDTINEVGNICASFGKDVILGNAYIGAATLQTFVNRYDSESGVTYYKWKYKATKWQIYNGNTGKWLDTDSNITDEGEKPNDSVSLQWLLADEAWDFIILQNGAYQSPYQDQSAFWAKEEGGNITNNIVQNMINRCKKSCLYSNPVFGMNMTWAFSVYHTISESHGPSGANDDKWLSYGSNQKQRQMTMWNNIATNYKACIENCEDVKFVIPSGTAVQNARANSTLRQSTIYTKAIPAPPTISQAEAITDLDNISNTYPFMNNSTNWANKTDFTRDSIHANFGITRYIIAATLFQTFIAKVLNLDIADCTYRIAQGSGNYREQLCTPVTDDNFNDIVACIKNAILKPYEITA